MMIQSGEEKEIRIDSKAEQEEIEIEEQGNAHIFIGDNPKLTLSILLSGRDASVVVIGRFPGAQNARQEITLRVVMQAPEAKCRVDMRAALAGSSASFFDGLIRVEEGAKNATGFLSYRALLLSSGARAKPIPRLEVLTKEVASLGHAASVGKIDEDQLFYLQSRGISRPTAEKLIVEGFLSEDQYGIIKRTV